MQADCVSFELRIGVVPVLQDFVFLTASGFTWLIRRDGLTYYFSLVSILLSEF